MPQAGGGYGAAPFGGGPFGGGLEEQTATQAFFDIFCFQGASMLTLLSEPSVTTFGQGGSFTANGSTNDIEVCSGPVPGAPFDDARILISENVPQAFTIEWIVNFQNLPTDFTDLVNHHIYLGCYDASGPVVGFFPSKIGWAYTGSVSFPGGNLTLDCTFQQIPGSSAYSFENEFLVVRVAADLNLGLVYFYVTKLSEVAATGQILRAILPVIPATAAASPPVDSSIISVRGTAIKQACAFFDSWCLASALIIPNLAPIANAGLDQAVRTCSIAQLDGSQSFDPEGANLLYSWRLLEAPLGSEFAEEESDGVTHPLGVPTGFTDKFHSTAAGVIDSVDAFDVGTFGDVLLVRGIAYTIVATGIDGDGFFVQIATEILPDDMGPIEPFKILRQRGLIVAGSPNGRDSVDPTFFPDVPGFYSFDLIVCDGGLLSASSITIVNVLESPLPRGCVPDLSFIFNYLSNFWNLVEGRERIPIFWSALAQVAATELFSLWQIDYSKSHRDIQRTFNRRWLHYDLLLGEPLPELTVVRPIFGGVTSSAILEGSGIAATTLVISSPVLVADVTITALLPDPYSATVLAAFLEAQLQDQADSRFTTHVVEDRDAIAATGSYVTATRSSYTDGQTFTLNDGVNSVVFEIDEVGDGVLPGNVSVDIHLLLGPTTIESVVGSAVNNQSDLGNLNITATVPIPIPGGVGFTNTNEGEGGNQTITSTGGIPGTFSGMSGGIGGEFVRIDAPFPFTIASATTMPIFTAGDEGRPPNGAGAGVGQRTYKVDRSLEELGLLEDDFLLLDGVAFRIARIIDALGDQFPFQRVVVKEELPVAPATTYIISGWVSSELLDFYNGLVFINDDVDFESADATTENAPVFGTNELLSTTALGANENLVGRLAVDFWPIGGAIADESLNVYLARVVRRRYVPVHVDVVDVPTLHEKIVIEDDEETLRRNLDYFIEEVRDGKGIRFVSGEAGDPGDVWEGARPPDRLWAEYTFFDNSSVIEANFGIPVELTVDQLEDLPDTVDYLSAVRGLWYAFFNGPAVNNIRIGSQILLGLPFAERQGTIEEIRTDFSPSTGRMLVRDTANEEIVRSYRWPRDLALEINPTTGARYAVDDQVEEFAPLVEGVEVLDYINTPKWFEGILNQGIFFEVEKFHKFLVRVDSSAFNLSSLLFVRNFVLKIKPTYTFPLFLVLKEIGDTEVSTTDEVEHVGTLKLFDEPCAGALGMAWMYDQPRAAGGGWFNVWDADWTSTGTFLSQTFDFTSGPALGDEFTLPAWLDIDCITGARSAQTSATTFVIEFEAHAARAYSMDGVTWGLLVESERINNVQEHNYNNWTPIGTVAISSAITPSGSTEDCEVLDNDAAVLAGLREPIVTISGRTYILSAWSQVLAPAPSTRSIVFVNLSSNLIVASTVVEAAWTFHVAPAAIAASGSSADCRIQPRWDVAADVGATRYWGIQCEEGAYPTSFMGADNVNFTRLADSVRVNNPGLVMRGGYFDLEIVFDPHYADTETAVDHTLFYVSATTHCIFRRLAGPVLRIILTVEGTTISTGDMTFSRHQVLTVRMIHRVEEMRLTVSGATSGNVDDAIAAEPALPSVPGQVYILGSNTGAEESTDLQKITFVYPKSTDWAYDMAYLCPDDSVILQCCVDIPAPTTISFDNCFAFGTPIQSMHEWDDAPPASPIPAGPAGLSMTLTKGGTINFNGTLVQLRFVALGDPGVDDTDYEVVIDVNGSPVVTEAFTMGVNSEINVAISSAVVATDTLAVRFRPASGGARSPNLTRIRAQVFNQAGAVWNFGDPIAAGTYCLEMSV